MRLDSQPFEWPLVRLYPTWTRLLVGHASEDRHLRVYRGVVRMLVAGVLILGMRYLWWRYTASINWTYWPLAFALLAAESYSFVDSLMFGLGQWRLRVRHKAPPPPEGATVDVFITCFSEPVEVVRETVAAAAAIRWPHRTCLLDDGRSPAMETMARELGVDYFVRGAHWQGKERHAKAGNLVNALGETYGEYVLILDADQIPHPEILYRTLGYFRDPKVAIVQTPQWFYNVPEGDPFGNDAPLFYGPIQQGKDGWNAAYFCGSNAVLRREALMDIGIRYYVRDQVRQVGQTLRDADRVLQRAAQALKQPEQVPVREAVLQLIDAVAAARVSLRRGDALQDVTWGFQQKAHELSRKLVATDLAAIEDELVGIPGLDELHPEALSGLSSARALSALTTRDVSPLAAIADVKRVLIQMDLDRAEEAEPVLPIATISVTEDMATSMRLHASGWSSVYHHEVLARGLAPEDLRTALQQRLRWAQGTIQVLLRENPLTQPGLQIGQRLMYFNTMWSYLAGFFTVPYVLSPVLYLILGWSPVQAYNSEFMGQLIPYVVANHLLFLLLGWGLNTWRGQQYALALFPVWIKAVITAVRNVYWGERLNFLVTVKARQNGFYLRLIWQQLAVMVAVVVGIAYGLASMLGTWPQVETGVWLNLFWSLYNLLMLSVVLRGATYRGTLNSGQPTGWMDDRDGRVGVDSALQ
jgi:cellulose synthase (UDP-forming)